MVAVFPVLYSISHIYILWTSPEAPCCVTGSYICVVSSLRVWMTHPALILAPLLGPPGVEEGPPVAWSGQEGLLDC